MAKTMQDIASQLGLSRTTVSLVLQGRGDEYRISRSTQNLIRARVAEADFRPNYFAQALTSGKSAVIGAIFPDVFEPFMSNLVRGIESVLYERVYSLTISTSRFDARREQALVDKTVWQGADGIILVPTMPFNGQAPYDSSHLYPLLDLDYPLVVVDRTIPGLSTHRVVQDDYGMTRAALEGLLAKLEQSNDARGKPGASRGTPEASRGTPGYRLHIVCVSFDLAASSVRARIQAYEDVMKAAGLQTEIIFLGHLDPDSTDLADAVHGLVDSGSDPDAWFVTTAGLAEKLHWLLNRPEDLPGTRPGSYPGKPPIPLIVRFGSSSRWLESPFVDIPQPHEKMGVAVASLILDLIDGKAGKACPDHPQVSRSYPGTPEDAGTRQDQNGMIEILCRSSARIPQLKL
ncbi:MAG: LacI family DNA-binding transcriptional regulator [Clostridia bacterium]